jgi:hypothetical protein
VGMRCDSDFEIWLIESSIVFFVQNMYCHDFRDPELGLHDTNNGNINYILCARCVASGSTESSN